MSLDSAEVKELMEEVQQLELRAKKLAQETLAGDYHSIYKGRGLDFDDYREYQAGDEIRFIDWNATARSGTPYLRTFKEERELNLMLVVDISGSTLYGSETKSKRRLAAEVAATLAFSALFNDDKVGLILFADKPVKYLPASKGRTQVLRIIRAILATEAPTGHAELRETCKFLNQVCKSKAMVALLSDFQDMSLEKSLATTAYRHDLLALRLEDPAEARLPKAGRVALEDPETGHQIIVNTKNTNIRMAYRKLRDRFTEGLARFFKKHSIDYLTLSTTEDFYPPLLKLYRLRAARKG